MPMRAGPRIPMATATTAATDRIGELLVREGLITAEQLSAALQDARQNGHRIGYSLIRLGFVLEGELERALAKQYRVPAVDPARGQVDPNIGKMLARALALRSP